MGQLFDFKAGGDGSRRFEGGSDAEQVLQSPLVEAPHHLVTHRDDGHRHLAGEPDQLLPSVDVFHHVDIFERHTFGAKELLRLFARHSGGGAVNFHYRRRLNVIHRVVPSWVPGLPARACRKNGAKQIVALAQGPWYCTARVG